MGLDEPIYKGELPKKGVGQFVDIGGLGKNEGGVFEGGLIPNAHNFTPCCIKHASRS